MMPRASRVGIGLVVVGGLVWAVSSLGTTGSGQPASNNGRSSQPAVESQAGNGSQLAGRYHLRGRTTRFFKRSTSRSYYRRRAFGWRAASTASESPVLAGRYHLRTRSTRFFKRSTGQTKSFRHTVGRRVASVSTENPTLAARYHLRGRTTRFFHRAIG